MICDRVQGSLVVTLSFERANQAGRLRRRTIQRGKDRVVKGHHFRFATFKGITKCGICKSRVGRGAECSRMALHSCRRGCCSCPTTSPMHCCSVPLCVPPAVLLGGPGVDAVHERQAVDVRPRQCRRHRPRPVGTFAKPVPYRLCMLSVLNGLIACRSALGLRSRTGSSLL
jgi:hypothetical protein